jgi:hypothetical protein
LDFGEVSSETSGEDYNAYGWQNNVGNFFNSGDDIFLGNHYASEVEGNNGNDYFESKPVRSDFDREIGLDRITSVLKGR